MYVGRGQESRKRQPASWLWGQRYMSNNWKLSPLNRRKVEQAIPKTGGLLSSESKKQTDQPALSSSQFVGARAKPTVPLGQSVQQQSKSAHPVPAAPSSGALVKGQFKARTASLSPPNGPQEKSKLADPLPATPRSGASVKGQFKARTAPLSPPGALSSSKPQSQSVSESRSPGKGSLGVSSKVKNRGVFVNTFNMMRQWSGKMARLAGYVPQPPAPYMERYHAPTQPKQDSPVLSRQSQPWKRSRTLRVTKRMKLRRDRWQKTGMKGPYLWSRLMVTLLAMVVVMGLSGTAYGYLYYESQLSRVESLANQTMPQSIRVYDRHNVLLYEHYIDHRNIAVTYDDIPQVMRDAMIAAEDPTFWKNSGIDPQGILRAAVGLVSHNGEIQSGGSTITQQVVKNLSQQTQDSAARKFQEAVTAMGMVQQYPKTKILEMYFNIAPFDNADLGIEVAVETYFHLQTKCDSNAKCIPGVAQLNYNLDTQKNDALLGLARASLLASMPQNPTAYDPTKGEDYKQAALGRQKYVLTQMINNNMSVDGLGAVTPEIAQQAEDLTAQMTFTPSQNYKHAPHFVDWVLGQIETTIGEGAFQVGGFNIRTTLDASLEDYVERAVKRHLTQPEYQPFLNDYGPLNTKHNVNDSAVVVINAHTGEILAMNGSADYNSTDPKVGGYYNAAAGGGRPVGSSFKPFEYASSFQMGWYPAMILPDNQTYVPNGGGPGTSIKDMYKPPDYGKAEFNGKMDTTIRWATDVSWNIGAVKAGAFVGSDNLLTNVKRMGLNHITDTHASWALGTNNASVLEMTGAYQTFADGGTHIPPQGILDIWDNYGRSLYHYDPAHPPTVLVFSPQVAYLMTSVLIDQPTRAHEFLQDYVLSFADFDASCIYLSECPHQVAAKTGTTDATIKNAYGQDVDVVQDNWAMGYTPNVAVGVWSGNANNDHLDNVVGITGAAPIWHSAIATASGHCPQDDLLPCPTDVTPQSLGLEQQDIFPKPAGVSRYATNMVNGLASAPGLPVTDDYIIDGLQPSSAGLANPASVPNSTPQNSQPAQPTPTPGQPVGPTPQPVQPTPTPGVLPTPTPGVPPTPTAVPSGPTVQG
jgi:membrane peptidoglycan carboxypeptidase